MSDSKISDCCIAGIHQRSIDILNVQEGLPNIVDLRCHNCGNRYRLVVSSGQTLRSEIDSSGYHIIRQYIVDIERKEPMKSRLKAFTVLTQTKNYAPFKFIDYDEEPEQLDELETYVD